jgi:hypothetical protein
LSGRNPRDAVQAYLDRLQASLSCVSKTRFNVSGRHAEAEEPHSLTTAEDPISLKDSRILLSINQRYKIVKTSKPELGPWKVSTFAYSYWVMDSEGREVLLYQWAKPGQSLSSVDFPHLHLGPGAGDLISEFDKAHLPSGRIAFEEIVRLAVEMGAEPLREDVDDVLTKNLAIFREYKTW